MDDDSRLKAQLSPLETALLSVARDQAAARRRDADSRAAAIVHDGEAQARTLLERATAEGAHAATHAAARRLVEARRQARACVLEAQRVAYDQLIARAAAAAEALHEHPEYADLERRLVEVARGALGPDAQIVRNPDGRAGVRAVDGTRSVDLTLSSLSRRCVEQLGQEVTNLWA
ncbi:MAG: hypothetical protein ACREPM_15950 [Gemmatimonadaceae bacterium]